MWLTTEILVAVHFFKNIYYSANKKIFGTFDTKILINILAIILNETGQYFNSR